MSRAEINRDFMHTPKGGARTLDCTTCDDDGADDGEPDLGLEDVEELEQRLLADLLPQHDRDASLEKKRLDSSMEDRAEKHTPLITLVNPDLIKVRRDKVDDFLALRRHGEVGHDDVGLALGQVADQAVPLSCRLVLHAVPVVAS